MGVKGVTNNIQIKSEIHDKIEQQDVENAIARSWSINDNDIRVKVAGKTVSLIGTVTSWYQKEEAGRIAWNTSGNWLVRQRIRNRTFSRFSQLNPFGRKNTMKFQ